MGRRVPLVLACGLLSSCGAGVVAVVASSGSSGGGTTPALDSFVVEKPKISPARLRLDASQAVRVGLFYDFGQGEQAMSKLRDLDGNEVDGNEVDLTASEVLLDWDFAAEPGGKAGFTPDVRLMAKHGGAVISGGELKLGLGNDAPEVRSIDEIDIDPDEGEASGTTGIELTVADSSEDVVSVSVEFDVQGDVPDAGWQLARPALLDPGLPTPEFGLAGVQVARKEDGGTRLSFFWDTDALTDLKDLERDVQLRFTPDDGTRNASGDPVGMGESMLTSLFRVDNNAAPIVQLDSGPLILNPDERRGIPIPFRVIDEEGDLVEVIFQWRHEGEEFPSLDRDGDGKIENAEVDEILADKELRQQFHVCTEYPHFAQGRVVPIDENTVRLPELASSESWILASGIVGKTLELLRPSSIPAPVTPTWRSNPLVSPIAALPVGDGTTALVLDVPGLGRLREVELAIGKVVREISTLGPGIPTTMAFERREKAVLVALDDAGTWRIERVDLASGAVATLIVSDGAEPAPVRGIASLGTNAAVFTAGGSLLHLDYRDSLAPQLGKLLTGLASPWGVVVDPLPPDRLYLAEHDANRVVAIELEAHSKLPVVVKTADLQPATLTAPRALALERNGADLLVVTSAPGGKVQLESLDIGAEGGNLSLPIGATADMDVAGLAAGPDGLRLLCLPAQGELQLAGGIEQRRAISAHSALTEDTSVELPFDPVPMPGRRWRIAEAGQILRAGAQGIASRFVWNSTDALGSVLLRGLARDEEVGAAADGAAPKRARGGLEVEPVRLGGPGVTDGPASVAAADLDEDGDQDLVSANAENLTVFFQLSPGIFSSLPLVLGGPGMTNVPVSVAAADLDGDGDQDLVSANANLHNLAIFFQLSPGGFAAAPLSLGGFPMTSSPSSVAAADLDGDGDQDLVSANGYDNHNLTIFFQLSPGSFSSSPLVLGGPGVTDAPASVAASDLDGDSDLDLVSANANGHNLTVFFQLSPGSFSSSPLALGGPGVTQLPTSVAAADLDGDGDQDLVSANQLGHDLTAFFQLSSGSFSSPLALGAPGVTSFPGLVVAADFDGDGDQDLVSANHAENNLTAFFQHAPGSFSNSPLVFGVGVSSVTAADLDGDGDQDLVSASQAGNHLMAFFHLSAGSFAASPLVLGDTGVTDSPQSVAPADLDGDGDLDLVSANLRSNNLTAFFQPSPGSFSSSPLAFGGPGVTDSPASVDAADLDGDGDLDLVSANCLDNLTVFFQLTHGRFSASPHVIGGPGVTDCPFSVAAADLDGDGDQDLVSANNSSNLTVFFQVAPGRFSAAPIALGVPGVTDSPASVAAADLDGDGDLDLVSANGESNNLTAFFQPSPGSFSSSPLAFGGPGVTDLPFSVAAADLDGDGDQDLVSANRSGNNLTVFSQLSTGSFSSSPLVLGGPGVTGGAVFVAAADLDGDGDRDLVSANASPSSRNLTVFFQLFPGSFSASPLRLGGPGVTHVPSSVAAADLDGDGDHDLVSANEFGDNLTIFFGGR